MENRRPKFLAPIAGAIRPWLGLAVVVAGFSLDPRFREVFWPSFVDGHPRWAYPPQILQQAATNIILAVGMTFVILSGGIDLSVGSVLAFCGVTLGMTVRTGPPAFVCYVIAIPIGVGCALIAKRFTSSGVVQAIIAILGVAAGGLIVSEGTRGGIQLEGAILAALAVGCACGLFNGLAVTIGRVPPFVVTLGMMVAARGLTVYATDGNSISGLPPRLASLGDQNALVIIALLTVVIAALVLRLTRTGRYFYAIGGNEEASRLTGVNIGFYKTLTYVISGVMAALAGVVLTAKFRTADTGAGTSAELNAIAAVVIGGTSLSGGQGSVLGSLVGALTIAVLNSGLVIVKAKDTLQGVVIGGVIVATVMLDQYRKDRH